MAETTQLKEKYAKLVVAHREQADLAVKTTHELTRMDDELREMATAHEKLTIELSSAQQQFDATISEVRLHTSFVESSLFFTGRSRT